jgi:hypothetical protein
MLTAGRQLHRSVALRRLPSLQSASRAQGRPQVAGVQRLHSIADKSDASCRHASLPTTDINTPAHSDFAASSPGVVTLSAEQLQHRAIATHPSYTLAHSRVIPELSICVCVYTHNKTKASIISIYSDESECVLGCVFPTPVTDDTGVAHILEHSVLCGSQAFPVKDPFLHLLKSSTHTYLNALTYSDRTAYVCASAGHKDLQNLMKVRTLAATPAFCSTRDCVHVWVFVCY